MSQHQDLVKNLTTLNQIIDTLNRAVDVRQTLDFALTRLVELMGLETGWIFLKDAASQNRWAGKGYILAAHHNLPEALKTSRARAWKGGCECQTLCAAGELGVAYNEVRCSRLRQAPGDRAGLVVHASALLRSGENVLGILNVAAPEWDHFSAEALVLLANVGSQMGAALERARLFDLLQERRIHEQAALLDFSNQLLSRPKLDDLLTYLVEEVCNLLQADACAIVLSLPGSDDLAFYAASGWLTDPTAAGRHIPGDGRSGSGRIMQSQEPLLIEDLNVDDPTPWTSDWIEAEGFRGHAAVPLVVEDKSIGVLMINTRTPRLLDGDELRLVRLMGNQAAMAIENARLHREELQRQRLEEELAVGQQIQHSMLPERCPLLPGWEICSAYQPARLVGGDFYDFFHLTGSLTGNLTGNLTGDLTDNLAANGLGVVIADVAGKGVPAALFMALSRTTIRTVAATGIGPAAALVEANRLLIKDSHSKMFLSAFYALLEPETGRLTYTSAGHNWPLWWRAGRGQCEPLSAEGILLGVLEEITLEERSVEIEPGDVLIFYTDGVTEAMNEQEELFGEARLEQVILSQAPAPATRLMEAIIEAIHAFTGPTPQSDDFTLCVIKRLPD